MLKIMGLNVKDTNEATTENPTSDEIDTKTMKLYKGLNDPVKEYVLTGIESYLFDDSDDEKGNNKATEMEKKAA